MQGQKTVDVLFLGTLQSQTDPTKPELAEKSSHHDEISFNDPVLVELLRIPHAERDMYSRYISKTQKTPIKGFEVYYRNLTTKNSRFSLLASYSSELLASETDDILITLQETILTDLLVIRGDFKTITLCIYGRVLTDPEEIEKRCPFFPKDVPVTLEEEKPAYKIQRNIYDESSRMVKAIEDWYSNQTNKWTSLEALYKKDIFSNDDELHEQQIQNISVLSQKLLQQFSQNNLSRQRFLVDFRLGMEEIQSHLAKLFKSAHIGLYYPSSYRSSTIPNRISAKVDRIAFESLSLSLSDQCRSLQILKFILQLSSHARNFVELGGVQALVRLFVEFFSMQSVILSSFKALILEVLITVCFWNFAAETMVKKIDDNFYHCLFVLNTSTSRREEKKRERSRSNSASKEKSRSRSREKKKKKEKSYDRSASSSKKKDKKNKKDKKKSKKRDRSKEKKEKDRKQKKKEKSEKSVDKNMQRETTNKKMHIPSELQDFEPLSFYEIVLKMMTKEKNIKLLTLFKILIQQITQTLTKNHQLSEQMAYYTPLLRDTKYMFNQGGELISSKPLKIFASFQPFLNDEQSVGVKSDFISESEKLKNPKEYRIAPNLFKVLDSVQTVLLSRAEDEIFSLYDEEFITSMSKLLELNDGTISIGFSNFIDALKIDSLLMLKKQEAAIGIICQYVYKIFLEDEGINTVFYMDQIHSSLLKLSTYLREDKTFSKEIKKKVRFLKNYIISFDHFSGAQNTFKNLADYFLRLIKYEHYQINKIKEYHLKDYAKSINPLNIANLQENFNFGSFFDLLPSQPLLQIDVCLKIFLVLIKFNRNIWSSFYENKLSCGFSSLFMRVHSLLKFCLTPSCQRHQTLIDLKFYEQLMDNYLSIMKRLTQILVHKIHYESAFNELLEEEDIFDSVELYEKLIDLYIVLERAYFSKDSLLGENLTKRKIRQTISLIIQFFDIVLKSYEIIKHQSREVKIRNILKFINQLHYESISNRSGVLSLIKVFFEVAETHTLDFIKAAYFDGGIRKTNSVEDALLPENELSVIENIILKNIFRSDPSIVNNLAGLLDVCLQKNNLRENITKVLQTIYEENEQKLKEELQEYERNPFTLKKCILLINLFGLIKTSISTKLDDRIIRFFRFVENNIRDTGSKEEFDLYRIRLRNSITRYIANSLQNNENSSIIIQYLKLINTFLSIQTKNMPKQFQMQNLKSTLNAVEALIKIGRSSYYQSFILYGDYFPKPYKPNCEISFSKIFSFFLEGEKKMVDEEILSVINKIGVSAFYFLCCLTTIDQVEFYSTESRKNAISALISPQKTVSIFEVMGAMETVLPTELVFLMKNYLAFPIVEKEQTYKVSEEEKPAQQNRFIGSYFSKSVFSTIGQGDPVSKTRFEYVQEKWEGGDVQKKVFSIENRKNYGKIVDKILHFGENFRNVLQEENFKELYLHTQILDEKGGSIKKNPFYSFVAKKTFTQEKKNPVDSVINLKNIPKVFLPPEQSIKQNTPKNQIPLPPQNNGPNLKQIPRTSPPNNNVPSINPPQPRSGSLNRNHPPQPPSTYVQPKQPVQPTYQPPQQQPIRQSYPQNPQQTYPPVPTNPTANQNYPYEQNRGYYPPNHGYDPRTNYPPQNFVPVNYQNQRNMMQPPVNNIQHPYQGGGSYRYPSQEELYNEGVQLVFTLKERPTGPAAEKMKERLNQILNTSPSLNKRISEYFSSFKR